MEKFRVFYLVGGVLFLIVSAFGGAWWELIAGDASKPALYVGFSPFEFKAKLFNTQVINPSPLMNALFTSERLLAMLGSTTIILGSLLQGKTWSRRLLNLRPLTMPVCFGILTIAIAVVSVNMVQRFTPYVAQALPNLGDVLMPYSSRYLTINLYPFTGVNGLVKVRTESRFTVQFWTALLSGALCLAGWMFDRKKAGTEFPPPAA